MRIMGGMVYIGRRLRRLRQERLLSQRELASRAGCSPNTVRLLETDRSEPNYGTLRKLVTALEVQPVELIGTLEDPDETEVIEALTERERGEHPGERPSERPGERPSERPSED